jgi:hypothetical protein
VMGCKWSEKVKSPFYKNVDDSNIKEALVMCDRLKVEGKLLADRLNVESLGYRYKYLDKNPQLFRGNLS